MTYDFSITGVLKEGFHRTDGVKLTFVGAVIIYAVISVIARVILKLIFPETESVLNTYASSLLEMLFTLPILIGIMMLGIKRARDEALEIPSIFDYFGMIIPIMLAYVAMTILIVIGFMLLIIPGIYLAISYAFTYTLIVDKGLGIWEAMELSRKTVTEQWFKFFGLSIVCGILVLISALPFGIGLIWTIPMTYTAYGLLYHRLFDEEE